MSPHASGRPTTDPDSAAELGRAVNFPHGGPFDPLTNADIRSKFHHLAELVIPRQGASAIERLVVGLADLEDITPLVDLIAAPTEAALN